MHSHDVKYPPRPGFEPGTPRIGAYCFADEGIHYLLHQHYGINLEYFVQRKSLSSIRRIC